MGELSLLDRLVQFIGGIGWRVFIWSLPYSEDEYFDRIYEQESAHRSVESATTSQQQPQGEICEWKPNRYELWDGYATSCGERVQSLMPLNGMRFCPYCGRKLSPVR